MAVNEIVRIIKSLTAREIFIRKPKIKRDILWEARCGRVGIMRTPRDCMRGKRPSDGTLRIRGDRKNIPNCILANLNVTLSYERYPVACGGGEHYSLWEIL